MTLSMPVKIVALAGLALALGGAALLLLFVQRPSSAASAAPPVHSAPLKAVPAKATPRVVVHVAAKPQRPRLVLDPNLPTPLHRGLLHSREVVVVVYSSTIAGDRSVVAAARAGARAAHVGFVALNVAREPIAASVAGWTSTIADPAVLVVRRPGRIAFTLSGSADKETIAQAAAGAR